MNEPYVLIVDDDDWQCASYQRIFSRSGVAAQIASNPEEAIEYIVQRRPDAIVLDMMLEGNTAFALLHELQSDAALATIPIVACTNMAEYLNEQDLVPYGVGRVLDKATMHPQDIVAALRMATA